MNITYNIRSKNAKTFCLIIFFLFLVRSSTSQIWLSPYYKNNIILQREKPLHFNGRALPGDSVYLIFAGKTYSTLCKQDGEWQIEIPAQKAGGKHLLTFRSGLQKVELNNVQFGDVWIYIGDDNLGSFSSQNIQNKNDSNYSNRILIIKPEASFQTNWKLNTSEWLMPQNIEQETLRDFATFFFESFPDTSKIAKAIVFANFPSCSIENLLSPSMVRTFPKLSSLLEKKKNQKINADSIKPRQYFAFTQNICDSLKVNKTTNLPAVYPSVVFNGMLSMLMGEAFSGVILSGGRFNLHNPKEYGHFLAALIVDWRQQYDNLPFILCQMPQLNIENCPKLAQKCSNIRLQQERTALLFRNLGIANLIDLNDSSFASKNYQQTKAKRIALLARELKNNKQISSSLSYKWKSLNDTAFVVEFKPENLKLCCKNGNNIQGFMLCDADSVFLPANAIIRDNKVIVWNKAISKPQGVSYLWHNFPKEINLVDENNVPIFPFISF